MRRYRRSHPGNREGASDEFSHRRVFGASFDTLEALALREWPSIESVGDCPPGESKSAMFRFANDHDFETVALEYGEMTIPIPVEES